MLRKGWWQRGKVNAGTSEVVLAYGVDACVSLSMRSVHTFVVWMQTSGCVGARLPTPINHVLMNIHLPTAFASESLMSSNFRARERFHSPPVSNEKTCVFSWNFSWWPLQNRPNPQHGTIWAKRERRKENDRVAWFSFDDERRVWFSGVVLNTQSTSC